MARKTPFKQHLVLWKRFLTALSSGTNGRVASWPSHKSVMTPGDRHGAIVRVVEWLKCCQDATPDAGSSAGYVLSRKGWVDSYPETTGYIITSFIETIRLRGLTGVDRRDLEDRSRQMGDWLLGLQNADGSFPGGLANGQTQPANLFNTGQIIQGLISLHQEYSDPRYKEGVEQAADWMCQLQDADGGWTKAIYDRDCRAYYARAIWPLAQAAACEFPRAGVYGNAAHRFACWLLERRQPNGWLKESGFRTPSMAVEMRVLHTIAYTIEGLLELGVCLDTPRYWQAALDSAEALLRRFEIDGRLYGEYSPKWRPEAYYVCVTGAAQMGRIWGRCWELTQDARFMNALMKLNDGLCFVQKDTKAGSDVSGAFTGSIPIYERYQPNQWPNWAAKFALDSLLIEQRILHKQFDSELRTKPAA